ncbi:MAG: hypothetical protein JNM84_23105 [Planctomycetes bacterium]|nr:hypothetical protein [Planctomycetota bacterium]
MSEAAGSGARGPARGGARPAALPRDPRAALERDAALFARGRKRARVAAGCWIAIAIFGAVQSLLSDAGRPLLSFTLLGITVALALMLGAGMPVARWSAVLFTSARGLIGLQWAERLTEARSRTQLLAISLLFLALAAVLLFDRSIAHYCRSRGPSRR